MSTHHFAHNNNNTLNKKRLNCSREVAVHKGRDGKRTEYIRVKKFMRDELADVRNTDLSAQHIVAWRDRELQKNSPATVNRDWNTLSSIFTLAVKEWGWLHENPMSKVKRPPRGEARTRLPTQGEIDRLLSAMKFAEPPITVAQRVAAIMLFAAETGMRAGEMCRMTWDDVREKSVYIPAENSKNGHARTVPLTKEARRIIALMSRDMETVFNLNVSQLDSNFRKYRKLAGIEGLHFHDFRRYALTRLSKKLDVLELARVSGHRDLRILLNVYYAPDMDDLADKLD